MADFPTLTMYDVLKNKIVQMIIKLINYLSHHLFSYFTLVIHHGNNAWYGGKFGAYGSNSKFE